MSNINPNPPQREATSQPPYPTPSPSSTHSPPHLIHTAATSTTSANHDYSSGIPSPPQIVVPPPSCMSLLLNPLNPHTPSAFIPSLSHPDHNYYNPYIASNNDDDIANVHGLVEILQTSPPETWRYESRRQAQEILPWLWLGPLAATRDKKALREKGITLVIAVRSDMTAKARLLNGHGGVVGGGSGEGGGGGGGGGGGSGASIVTSPITPVLATAAAKQDDDGPRHITLDLPPTPSAPYIQTFLTAAKLIDHNYITTLDPTLPTRVPNPDNINYHSLVVQHERTRPTNPSPFSSTSTPTSSSSPSPQPRPGSTLVFCETGNENSAVVVASYIMQHYGASVIQAVQIVQGRRFSVGLVDSMKYRLVAYEPIWRSLRQVERDRREREEALAAEAAVARGRQEGGNQGSWMATDGSAAGWGGLGHGGIRGVGVGSPGLIGSSAVSKRRKRGLEDVGGGEEGEGDAYGSGGGGGGGLGDGNGKGKGGHGGSGGSGGGVGGGDGEKFREGVAPFRDRDFDLDSGQMDVTPDSYSTMDLD